jgi:hypothetical protein
MQNSGSEKWKQFLLRTYIVFLWLRLIWIFILITLNLLFKKHVINKKKTCLCKNKKNTLIKNKNSSIFFSEFKSLSFLQVSFFIIKDLNKNLFSKLPHDNISIRTH